MRYYLTHGMGTKYTVMSVSVCLSVRISQQEGLAVASIARDVVV